MEIEELAMGFLGFLITFVSIKTKKRQTCDNEKKYLLFPVITNLIILAHMNALKILLGLVAMVLAWLFIFKKPLLFRVNAWVREFVFNDQIVLFSGRRMAVLLLILGGVALFSGIQGIVVVQPIKPNIAAQILSEAKTDLQNQNYMRVINRCRVLVRSDPKNAEAWEMLATSWWAIGNKRASREAVESLLRANPQYPIKKSSLAIVFEEHK